MKLISYVDMFDKDINMQIELANQFEIKDIFLSYVDEDILVTKLNIEELKDLYNKLRKLKVNVFTIDPKIESYKLDEDFDNIYESYEKAFVAARELKAEYVLYKIPVIDDVFHEFDLFRENFVKLVDLAKKYNKSILIDQNINKNAVVTYIFNHINRREIKLLFNPKQMTLNGESSLVGYRTLKPFFDTILVQDIDSKDNPELIGYGRVDLIDLLKRMGRDKFLGNVILDYSFNEFLNGKQKKVSLFKKLLNISSKTDTYLKGYGIRIFPNEINRIPTIHEVYLSQINALKILFNIKD